MDQHASRSAAVVAAEGDPAEQGLKQHPEQTTAPPVTWAADRDGWYFSGDRHWVVVPIRSAFPARVVSWVLVDLERPDPHGGCRWWSERFNTLAEAQAYAEHADEGRRAR